MATRNGPRTEPRTPLSRDRVLRAAVKVADESGIESLTMRRLAEELGAEAMSLYYHVAKKEDVLDGIVDVIAGEINEAVGRIDVPSGSRLENGRAAADPDRPPDLPAPPLGAARLRDPCRRAVRPSCTTSMP